ncbi:MAG: aldo/keto reductase [Candidatus Thermoplasmatota archaeon]|nr:aldo/keto reductase [Candidatus Thermoplasmatota archaeon]MBS3790052.1 aldo/keto reductase [Candidatus Thermoplasmatota archaeon]
MKYRSYKGLDISEVGMGCYALSGSYGSVDLENYKSVLNHALDLGINLFDTAATYGDEAEKILGEVITPVREDVIISTKIGMGDDGRPSLAYDDVKSACKNSLSRLNIDYIDIYLVHFDDPNTEVKETVHALEDLRNEGKIKHYGVSHLPAERVKEYLEEGDVSFCLMELSAVSRQSRKELLPLCQKYGTKAIAFSVTGRGILSGKIDEDSEFAPGDIRKMDPLFKKERFKSALRITEKLKEIGKKYDKTSTQVAINWVLSQDGVISALTGPSSKEHLEENVDSSSWNLKEADLREIESFLDKEEEMLEEKEPEIINEILKDGLPEKIEQAFNDLVYVMEVSIDRGMVEEKKIVPIFQELIGKKKGDEDLTYDQLEDIRRKVKGLIV